MRACLKCALPSSLYRPMLLPCFFPINDIMYPPTSSQVSAPPQLPIGTFPIPTRRYTSRIFFIYDISFFFGDGIKLRCEIKSLIQQFLCFWRVMFNYVEWDKSVGWFVFDGLKPIDHLCVFPEISVRVLEDVFVGSFQNLLAHLFDFGFGWVDKSALGVGVKVRLVVFYGDRQIDRQTDRWMDGWMDGWIDR